MIADVVTKTLGAVRYQKLVKEIGLYGWITRISVEINGLSTDSHKLLIIKKNRKPKKKKKTEKVRDQKI